MGLQSHFEHNILYTYKNKYTQIQICLKYAEFCTDRIKYYSYKSTHVYTHAFTLFLNCKSPDQTSGQGVYKACKLLYQATHKVGSQPGDCIQSL